MLILNDALIRQLLDPEQLLAALEEGFCALSAGTLDVPPRTQAATADGVLLCMPAAMPGRHVAVKLVSVFHHNHAHGLATHQATINLFDVSSGKPLALLDGEYLTALRTAAAALLSIRLLARGDSTRCAIVGAGVLAEAHLRLLAGLESLEEIRIAPRDVGRAHALAALDPRVRICSRIEEAVRDADIVCLCTSSSEPVVRDEWIGAGTHLSSVGYRPPGGEVPRALIERARVFVESRLAFSPPPAGSAELQGLDAGAGSELGEVLLGQRAGRESLREITLYKSMGHAMEDLVAANLVYAQALATGLGTRVEL